MNKLLSLPLVPFRVAWLGVCWVIGVLGWLLQPPTFLDGDFSDLEQREMTTPLLSATDLFRTDRPLSSHAETDQEKKGGNHRRA